MSIGAALAEARSQAGLTVAQVSQRTRIRQMIIRAIEHDDYSACGGDFYARGHIRNIAKVVGADPEPLIREYDTAHRAPGAISATAIDELVTLGRTTRRRRLNWIMAMGLALVLALGFVAYHFFPGSRHPANAAPAAGKQVVTHGHAVPSRTNPVPKTSPGAARSVHTVVVHLTAIRGCWVEFTTPTGGYLSRSYVAAGASNTWAFGHAVDMKLSNPAGIRLTVDGTNPLPPGPAAEPITLSLGPDRPAAIAPSPRPAGLVRTLTPVSAAAVGPGGQGDNPQHADLAIDGSHATAWRTDWYTTARFGNLYSGTGLLLDMGHPVTITGARITLGSARGASFQIRVGAVPAPAHLPPVARAADTGGVVHLRLITPAHGRYVLLWFTRMPADPAGTFQASVYNVSLQARR